MIWRLAFLAAPLLSVLAFVAVAEAVNPEPAEEIAVASASDESLVATRAATESKLSPSSAVSSLWLLSFAGGLAMILELLSPVGIFSRLVRRRGRPAVSAAVRQGPPPWVRLPAVDPVYQGARSERAI
jgi:hypothetical protein